MSQQPDFLLDLDAMRRTVAEALRERNCDGHPRPTLTTLGRLLPRLRVHAAALLPIIEGRLQEMSADDPRRGEIGLEVKRARGAQDVRLTNDFPRDIASMRHLARLVSTLIDITADGRQPLGRGDAIGPDHPAPRASP
ncbi:DUF6415 family natural product biosynthesis protein [Streptomyces sp. NBC_01456]|uniref:DUF6415 family natural product biosynthesis protein n=1 Tax=Streptomyces sp. NBC_01456 TaxID=2975868 RepID=UPI002E368C84|nr:DUF6415 family natural product biosynthesis protein [Streptomyces sp. NBC_01456]